MVEVEILSRFQSLATVTAVVKWVTMYGTVPSGTRNGTHLLLVLRILLPRCITRGEINLMLLCPIALCTSAGIIIKPQVMTLGRIPRVVLLVLVVMPPLLWLLLGVGSIWMMTSSHSLSYSYTRCYVIGKPVHQGLGWLFTSLATFKLGFLVDREMATKILTLQEFY